MAAASQESGQPEPTLVDLLQEVDPHCTLDPDAEQVRALCHSLLDRQRGRQLTPRCPARHRVAPDLTFPPPSPNHSVAPLSTNASCC